MVREGTNTPSPIVACVKSFNDKAVQESAQTWEGRYKRVANGLKVIGKELEELGESEGVKDITIKTEMLNVLSFNSERL